MPVMVFFNIALQIHSHSRKHPLVFLNRHQRGQTAKVTTSLPPAPLLILLLAFESPWKISL